MFLSLTFLAACATVDQTPLPKVDVRSAVSGAQPEISKCYDELLKKEPHAQGKIVSKWEVDEKGEPSKVTIDSSNLPEMNDCMLGAIKKLKFPPAKPGQIYTVTYPFTLRVR